MLLHKIPHPDNFQFVHRVLGRAGRREARTPTDRIECQLSPLGEDVFRLALHSRRWKKRQCLHELRTHFEKAGNYELKLAKDGALSLSPRRSGAASDSPRGPSGSRAAGLGGPAAASLGLNGQEWMLRLDYQAGDRFFGMGEKWGPLEKGGGRFQFWNTDLWADHPTEDIQAARVDATYASIPYLIIERRGVFFGVLLDNPFRAFMATGPRMSLFEEGAFDTTHPDPEAHAVKTKESPQLHVGATDGQPIVYFLVGPTLRELTRKLQRLLGTTPRPPLWALGHHQSRWGYASSDDLLGLDQKFEEHAIPTDGLWLDIDYMDQYRVFTTRSGALHQHTLDQLDARRRRIVPILDPGVKVEPGYSVYEEGMAGGHFCLAPSGRAYTGIVWPGRTHFPDFSQKKTRKWWAGHVAEFVKRGFHGFWIDMNDPSTGPIENESMLFAGGKWSHAAFHNQYALGMARATREGLSKAAPGKRPFVLSRSASTGMASYAAVWTGDNVSNHAHLAAAIPVSLNLALSGVPFNGPDVPGFGGDVTPELAERFYRATFLFPFLRNHSVQGSRHQEPWALGDESLEIIRHYIRLRYRFLPYLYRLFVEHERTGEPIWGPVFLDGPSGRGLRDDQFMLGPDVLVAPLVTPENERSVWLPRGDWFCLRTGAWLKGGREHEVQVERQETPLYVRAGALLPLCRDDALDAEDGGAPDARRVLTQLELHAFLRPGQRGEAAVTVDDGETLDYQKGRESTVRFAGRRSKPRNVEAAGRVELDWRRSGSALEEIPVSVRVFLHGMGSEAASKAGMGTQSALRGMGTKAASKAASSGAALQVAGRRIEVQKRTVRFSGRTIEALATALDAPLLVQ